MNEVSCEQIAKEAIEASVPVSEATGKPAWYHHTSTVFEQAERAEPLARAVLDLQSETAPDGSRYLIAIYDRGKLVSEVYGDGPDAGTIEERAEILMAVSEAFASEARRGLNGRSREPEAEEGEEGEG